jgi:hypothetical protein
MSTSSSSLSTANFPGPSYFDKINQVLNVPTEAEQQNIVPPPPRKACYSTRIFAER